MVTRPSVPPYSSTTSAMWMCVDCMRMSRLAAGIDGGTKIIGRRSLVEAIGFDRFARPSSGTEAAGSAAASAGRSACGASLSRLHVALARRPAQGLADQPAHHVLDVHHAARIVERLAKERQARDAGGVERLQQLPDRLVLVDGDDVGARHHHVDDAQRAEAEDAQQHLPLLGREGAAVAGALERVLEHGPQRRRSGQAEPGAQGGEPTVRRLGAGSAAPAGAPSALSFICLTLLTLMASRDKLSSSAILHAPRRAA